MKSPQAAPMRAGAHRCAAAGTVLVAGWLAATGIWVAFDEDTAVSGTACRIVCN